MWNQYNTTLMISDRNSSNWLWMSVTSGYLSLMSSFNWFRSFLFRFANIFGFFANLALWVKCCFSKFAHICSVHSATSADGKLCSGPSVSYGKMHPRIKRFSSPSYCTKAWSYLAINYHHTHNCRLKSNWTWSLTTATTLSICQLFLECNSLMLTFGKLCKN